MQSLSEFTLKNYQNMCQIIFCQHYTMGCKVCYRTIMQNGTEQAGSNFYQGSAKQISPGPPTVSAILASQIHGFMDHNLYKIFIKIGDDIFKDIQFKHNGVPVKGTPLNSWVPAGQGFMYRGEKEGEKKHGRGILYDQLEHSLISGCFYEDNLLRTNCRKIYANGTEYRDQLDLVYKLHGVGKVIARTYTYKGQLKNDMFDGKGMLIQGKVVFKGKFKNGKKIFGIQQSPQGIYEGYFSNNLKQGKGVFKWADGGRYEGSFVEDKIHGVGKLYDADGKYCGMHKFQNGKKIVGKF